MAVSVEVARQSSSPYGDVYIDDYYGRIFDRESHDVAAKYGRIAKMRHYVSIPSLEVVEELRVPYRRIPVYRTDNLAMIKQLLAEMQTANSGHQILVRGQTKTYLIERDSEESRYFYGEERVKEPSFLSSHLRKKFDPYFLKCMWQSQAAILLNDIGYELGKSSGDSVGNSFLRIISEFRNSPRFILFSLGIAQHYGLPSVGLDLTDRLDVACWFAMHTITTSASGKAKTDLIEFSAEQSPTIFVFRCPRDAVFNYKDSKPNGLPDGRPDRQSAWFGHVGWGAASNQLGSYLMCGFRLTPDIANQIDSALDIKLFPRSSDDVLLELFMNLKSRDKNEGEAKRAFQGIYYMGD